MENEVVRTGISPVLIFVLIFLAAAVIVLLLLSRNPPKSRGKVPLNPRQPVSPPPPAKTETELPKLTEVLNRRILLEERIMGLIGGKMGMIELWHRISESAKTGDAMGFRMFASTFPLKNKMLRKDYDELMSIVESNTYSQFADRDNLAVRLIAPYEYKDTCEQLFSYSKALEESGLLGRDDVTNEEVKQWYDTKLS